jgi:Tol biopolymer transport system component
MRYIQFSLLSIPVALLLCAGSVVQTPEALLGSALHQESVIGDLAGAIEMYRNIMKTKGVPRPIAAQAQLHLGICYERSGRPEARQAFETVVRDYPDQREFVLRARTLLAKLRDGPKQPALQTRLLWDNALDLWGHTSFDGRYLSFVDWSTCDLALRDLTTGENRKLTAYGGCDAAQAEAEGSAVSPDGRRVAFGYRRFDVLGSTTPLPRPSRAELRIIGTDATGERTLDIQADLNYVEVLSWSQDGKWILAGVTVVDSGRSKDELIAVSADSGEVRWFPSPNTNWRRYAAFSPDGRWIAYSSAPRGGQSTLYMRTAETAGTERAILANAAMMGWTPDGKGLLFCRERGGLQDLFLVPIEHGRVSGRPVKLFIALDAGIEPAGITRDGSLLYKTFNRHAEAHVVPWLGSEPGDESAALYSTQANTDVGWLLGSGVAHFSNDGKRIFAYTPQRGITIRNLTTGGERSIVPSLPSWKFARWRHDDAALLALGTDANGRTGIFNIDDATGQASLLTELPAWTRAFTASRDGRTLFWGTPQKTLARDLATGRDATLFETQHGGNYDLRLSRDGSRLAIRGGVYLAVVDLLTGDSRIRYRVPERTPTLLWAMDWSAGDKEIHVIARPGGMIDKMELWTFHPTGGPPRRRPLSAAWRGLSFSPDGKSVATTKISERWQLWTIENFLPATK